MADYYVTTPVPPFNTAIGAAFNTFTTRQDVSFNATTFPLPTIMPYQLRPGTSIRINASGEFSTTATPTLSIGVYIGAAVVAPATITTVIAENTAITTGTGAASWPWYLEWMGLCTVTGSSGSVTGNGFLTYGTSLTAVTTVPIPSTLALRTITWDTSIARSIGVCATWSASSASNSIKTYDIKVSLVN